MKHSQKQQKEKAAKIVARLEEHYPAAVCALRYEGQPWKLMVMGRLSAQCTDARVNIVCKDLFAEFPTPEALAYGDLPRIEELVRPCGLYRMKAAQIKEECRMLVEDFGGEMPSDMDALLTFPGVGRKIANLLRGDLFGLPAIVADTHCIRISSRLGLTDKGEKRPEVVERTLAAIVAPEKQADFCHRLVMFGREVCDARTPKCEKCPLYDLCAERKA
jgi:endonuclease-3